MANTDSETGESIAPVHKHPEIEIREYDLETGELDGGTVTVEVRRPRFIIPKKLIEPNEPAPKGCIPPDESFTLTKKEQVISLQEEIILGYNKTSHRLFLFPSILIFMKIWAPLISIVEICLHTWAHRKNASNTNPNIYYRSPMHIVSSQFCAYCRNKSEMERVSKIQDKRRISWHAHLRDLSKSVS